jgi:hypothetical protein
MRKDGHRLYSAPKIGICRCATHRDVRQTASAAAQIISYTTTPRILADGFGPFWRSLSFQFFVAGQERSELSPERMSVYNMPNIPSACQWHMEGQEFAFYASMQPGGSIAG